MGHWISSIFFVTIIVLLFLKKSALKDKINLIKTHKILGSIFIVYMTLYSVIDFIKDKDMSILFIIPFLIGIYFTGRYKSKIKYKHAHSFFVILFLDTLLFHVFT